jgi:hypothetical protein
MTAGNLEASSINEVYGLAVFLNGERDVLKFEHWDKMGFDSEKGQRGDTARKKSSLGSMQGGEEFNEVANIPWRKDQSWMGGRC